MAASPLWAESSSTSIDALAEPAYFDDCLVVEDATHRGDPSLGLVVGAVVEAPQERQAFDADQELAQTHVPGHRRER